MTDQASIALVRRLCTEWPTLSRADLHAMLTPDCIYINMPMPAGRCIGPDQTYDLLAAFVGGWTIDMQVLHLQGDAATVLTERLETFRSKVIHDKVVQLHVMGTFEIRDGKIAHWRDYFDSKESAALTS
jgi:limonene-1,2-epoxide hydrolase